MESCWAICPDGMQKKEPLMRLFLMCQENLYPTIHVTT